MDYKTEAQPKATAGGVPVFCAHDAIVAIEKLIPNPKNPNTHPDAQIQALGRIIRQTGWRAPITVSKRSGFIVKGHGRLAAAKLEGLTEVPVDYQNYTNEAEEYADLVADNRIAELAEIDNKLLADIFADIDTGEIPMELTGYTDKEVESLVTGLAEALHNDLTEPDEIPELPEEDQTITQRGDLWILGNHRLVCGDSTNEADRALLLDGAEPQILLMDPPYCSGGFQESGRSTGSIGTKRYDANGKEIKVTIANDTLSTRGYQQLMRSILKQFTGTVVYCFTDWRMWLYLYDVMEESGFGVKNMIVWNKKTPGMGMGWRTQHELIMFAHRTKAWASQSGEYYILTGMDANANEGIAIATKASGIRIRKTEELIEDAVITDDGIGYALSDEGTLFILSEGKAATKKLCGDAILDAWALTPEFCVVVYDADSDYDENDKEIPAVNVKLINLSTAASWRKKIHYSSEGRATLQFSAKISGNMIRIETPDNVLHEFTPNGTKTK